MAIGLAGITGLIMFLGGDDGPADSSITVRQAPTRNGVEVLVTVPDEINVLRNYN